MRASCSSIIGPSVDLEEFGTTRPVKPLGLCPSYFHEIPSYAPGPRGASVLRRQGFGGLSASGEIRRCINTRPHECLNRKLRIHPRTKLLLVRRSACLHLSGFAQADVTARGRGLLRRRIKNPTDPKRPVGFHHSSIQRLCPSS